MATRLPRRETMVLRGESVVTSDRTRRIVSGDVLRVLSRARLEA